MSSYILIESRDPFESGDTGFCRELARCLVGAGHRVTLFLVQNGVLPARIGACSGGFADLARKGVEVLADDFSLRERGIDTLQAGVKPSRIDLVIDRMAEGCKILWH